MARRMLAVVAALLLPLTACGGDDENDQADGGQSQGTDAPDDSGDSGGDQGSGDPSDGGSGDGSGGGGGGGGGGAPDSADTGIEAVCPLLPVEEVEATFGIADVTATEDEPATVGTGAMYGCSYMRGDELVVHLNVTSETSDADPKQTLDVTTSGQPGVEAVGGVGDAAAFWAQSGVGEILMAVKKSDSQLRTITLAALGSGAKDKLVAIATTVADQI